VLEVITEQRGGDLENLYKICRDECEKFKLHSRHNKNSKYLDIIFSIHNNLLIITFVIYINLLIFLSLHDN